MWLLSTDRAELHFFTAPGAVIGGYAILSHTWEDRGEQTYQQIRKLEEHCNVSNEIPRDLVSPKIRHTCLLAERHGFKWVWIDACCIDKTSSTELSEAINSMFRWYAASEVCFAYLADVPGDDALHAPGSAFRKARWHTRGWTLQELIAPLFLLFVSQDWEAIGNKLGLASLLADITGIREEALKNESSYSTESVATRMAWATNRRTTRIEDEAYCLMGLFHVNMPTIYGEGKHAFQRLQQEIMRQSSSHGDDAKPMTRQRTYNVFYAPSLDHFFLLAQSVSTFGNSQNIRYSPNTIYSLQPYLPWQWKPEHNEPADSEKRTLGPFGRLELPKFHKTNYGMKCRFPVFEVQGITVAMLMADDNQEHFGLLLHPTNDNLTDPSSVCYSVGWGFDMPDGGVSFVRRVHLGKDWYNLSFLGEPVKPEWRDIYIADSFPEYRKVDRVALCHPLHNILPAPPFRFPNWLIDRLLVLGLGTNATPLIKSSPKDGLGTPLIASMYFEDVAQRECILFHFGTCSASATPSPDQDREGTSTHAADAEPVHWATTLFRTPSSWSVPAPLGEHDCTKDHVRDWPGWAREFVDDDGGARVVRLAFTCSTLAPAITRVFHLELAGRRYEEMMASRNVWFPPRAQSDVDAILAEQGAGGAGKIVETRGD
ncbi:HET-domain-containing protein [Epithele typhae]|uniref:HET-domain-containing protein n=1 Tax=Epithele typhae TaxID=378194 RepID=UPI002008128C|nr:HET-domain-containing protein [Epithele typhae]KAH9915175.1 HET-domain-containing protein [Epithele typhae]